MFFDPTSGFSFFAGLPLLDLALLFPTPPCIDAFDKLREHGVSVEKGSSIHKEFTSEGRAGAGIGELSAQNDVSLVLAISFISVMSNLQWSRLW